MDDGQNSAIAAPLPSEKEIQYEGQTIAYDEHGQAIGIEEETTRHQALFMGVLLFVFGGVFFFTPLGMLISELQYADVEEMFCLIPFFSVFLLVGGALLVGSLFSFYSGITGNGDNGGVNPGNGDFGAALCATVPGSCASSKRSTRSSFRFADVSSSINPRCD